MSVSEIEVTSDGIHDAVRDNFLLVDESTDQTMLTNQVYDAGNPR